MTTKRQAEPMHDVRRLQVYERQNGSSKLTPRQRKRYVKKALRRGNA